MEKGLQPRQPRAPVRGDDVAAKHVSAALMEQGTRRVFELIAVLQEANDTLTVEDRGDGPTGG